jgi:hypothetical protein
MALLPYGIASEANAASDTRAECLSTDYVSYYPLGYDPARGKYLSEAERNGLAPAVEVSLNYRRVCNYFATDLKLEQFRFLLKIKGYRNGTEIPLLRSVDLSTLGASLTFSVPGLGQGEYTGTLIVQDISTANSNRREIDLNQIIRVYGSTPSPTPTKAVSAFRNLYSTDSVWIVGNSAKLYSCWSSQIKALKLQVKVRGKWISKTSAKFGKDLALCSGKYPWAAKYSWSVDEYGEVPRPGSRGRNLMVREFAPGLKSVSSVSRVVYASNSDRIQDGIDAINDELDLSLG